MKVDQPLGRIDVFSRTIGPKGFTYKRVNTSPYLISYWIEWETLPVGIIHLRSIQDDVTDISFFFYSNEGIPLNIDLGLLWNLPYDTEETKKLILGLANEIINMSRSPKFGFDHELMQQYDLLSGELRKFLHSLAGTTFQHYLRIYLEKLSQDFSIEPMDSILPSTQKEQHNNSSEATHHITPTELIESEEVKNSPYKKIDPTIIKIIIEWVERDSFSPFRNMTRFLDYVHNKYERYISEKEFQTILVNSEKLGIVKKGANNRWILADRDLLKKYVT